MYSCSAAFVFCSTFMKMMSEISSRVHILLQARIPKAYGGSPVDISSVIHVTRCEVQVPFVT